MPDDDKIPSSLTAPWKRVLRCLRSCRPVEETADVITSALAATLREAGKGRLDAGAGYRSSSPEGSFAFQAMLWQVSRLRACLDREDPWHGLVLEYPELLDATPLTPTEVTDLYRSYIREWDQFPEAIQIGRTAAL
jgi:hypothetical protein